jgi:predicted ester cyclase
MGPPATGREVSVLAADFGVVRDGRFVERWRFLDQPGLIRQLGLARASRGRLGAA